MESLYYRKAPVRLFYEYCLILCSWAICIYCDKMAEVAMTIPSTIALCLIIQLVLRSQVPSRYLGSTWNVPKRCSLVSSD
jgi:hypothetical protein